MGIVVYDFTYMQIRDFDSRNSQRVKLRGCLDANVLKTFTLCVYYCGCLDANVLKTFTLRAYYLLLSIAVSQMPLLYDTLQFVASF